MSQDRGPSGELLLVIALLVSLQIAQGRTADELGTLAAFFTVLGDNLALIAVRRPAAEAAGTETGVKSIDKLGGSV